MLSTKENTLNIEKELKTDDTVTIKRKSNLIDTTEDSINSPLNKIPNHNTSDDVYEFTFDPNEESPPPAKKAAPRKKFTPKPKIIFVNNNYETSVLKTLETLKNSLNKKSIGSEDKENEKESLKDDNENGYKSPKSTLKKVTEKEIKLGEPSNERPCRIKVNANKCSLESKTTQKNYSSPWRADIDATDLLSLQPLTNKNNNLYYEKAFKPGYEDSSLKENKSLLENTPKDFKLKQPSLTEFIQQKSANHLFEDIQVAHSFKPSRRSYGKKGTSPRTSQFGAHTGSNFAADISVELSAIRSAEKKAVRKTEQKIELTKKEEDEVNAWADAFNSMCEDVDEFPLAVE